MRELTKIKTLYVDDMGTIRSVLKKHFASLEFDAADAASDGVDAWVMIKKAHQSGRPYELVLCDWNMPKLDGIDLLRMLRAHPDAGIRDARFIMIAGSDEKYRRAMDAGADSVIAKPFTTSSLEKKISFLFRHDAS